MRVCRASGSPWPVSRRGDGHDPGRIVPASGQFELARPVPGASVHEADAGHAVCITAPQPFA